MADLATINRPRRRRAQERRDPAPAGSPEAVAVVRGFAAQLRRLQARDLAEAELALRARQRTARRRFV